MVIGIDARMYGSGFTGIGRCTQELITQLGKMELPHEFVIFLNAQTYETFSPPTPRFKKVLANYPHYSFSEQWGFLKTIRQERVDLMHFTHFNAPLLYRGPLIVTIHDLTLSFFPGKKMAGFLHRLAYHAVVRTVTRRARAIIAVSNHTKKDLIHALGLPSSKIHVIYNGIDPNFSHLAALDSFAVRQKFGLEKPYFLYTGVWRDHKNVVGLIRAFAAFHKKSGGAYQLAITGPPNPAYCEVPDIIKTLGLQEAVRLVGLVNEKELMGLYRTALCYAFPSFYEGFGLPPLEAMQCGVPVIASNTSAIPEVCGEGNALFFDPYSIDAMVSAMEQISRDETLRKTLIGRGLERVKAFSWKEMAKGVADLYKTALL